MTYIDLHIGLSILLIGLIIGGLLYVLLREWQCLPTAIRRVYWQEGNHWILENGQAQKFEAVLLADSISLPYLVILNFKVHNRFWVKSVVLLQDSLDSDSFRRLRVRLKIDSSLRFS